MIQETINEDIKGAMRSKDTGKLAVLRSLKNAFDNAAIQNKKPLEEVELLALIRKQVKQREDSIEQFIAGQRFDLAAKERDEKNILEKYLPAEIDDNDLDTLVNQAIVAINATSKKEMGAVIKKVIELTNGAVDNRRISQAVGAKLK